MKHCVQFPDENILIVRPCLVAICAGNRPAAKLLGSLLFRGNLRIENKDDAKNLNTIKSSKGQTADQDTSTRIYRKQSQLVDDMCGEITEKTIHDVAVPWLQFLGYLDIQEFPGSNCYDVHFEAVQAALDVYVNNPRQLEKFLIDHLQLEKFLIDLKIEKFPIDKKSFLLVLEIILIANRNISNDKRGRKPTSEGSLGSISRRLKNLKEITKKDTEQEREIPPNTLDTHTIVSSDTAHAEYPLTAFDEKMTIKETEIRQMLEGVASEEIIQQTIETFRKAVLAHRETRYHELPMPTTYAEAVIYLAPHGGVPPGYDAVQVMSLAQKLYAEAHSQDEEMFRNDVPQGDTHATAASGHPHRDSALPVPGVDGAGSPSQNKPLATPEGGPVLEAQEITEGGTHATRVPTVPRADHPASGERHAARHPQNAGHRATRATDDLPVVCVVGSGTSGQEAGRDTRDAGRDATQTLGQTPPTSTPAQSLPLPQAEQATLGAKWNVQTMVAKACELRGKPFSDIARPKETKAAQKLFARKPDLTEEEFERAFQQWNTQWWRDTNGLFNLTDLAAVPKNKSEMRLIIALEKLALPKARDQGKKAPVITLPNQPITNIRELVRQREALRAAALVGV